MKAAGAGQRPCRTMSGMKKLLFAGAAMLALFELANVYLIMPMPYSQRWRSIDVAYTLYSWRWGFRAVACALTAVTVMAAPRLSTRETVAATIALVVAGVVAYSANFVLAADAMFLEPSTVNMQPAASNTVEPTRLVVGIDVNGETRAYPVQFIGYHHQVRDVVAGTPVMVTFCTVCRTGRVFSPMLDGVLQTFRLVGMDHFNAMFEDVATRSWWRQATGEAIVGPRKGKVLADIPSEQMTLAQWLTLHPKSLIMQADPASRDEYGNSTDYETGKSRSELTGTNPDSWQEKSWVVGITLNGKSRAYDWNRLVHERVINDELGGQPIALVLALDSVSFFAYRRPDAATRFSLAGDRLVAGDRTYDLGGRSESGALTPVFASQEFWHSWQSFHPDTDTQ